MNSIEIYQSKNGKTQIEVKFENDTVWLSLNQIAELFGRDKSVISRHLKNIFREELDYTSSVAKNATVQKEGKRMVLREIEFFLLKTSGEIKINDNALTAIALLTAQSNPAEKGLIIKLICNLIN